MKANRSQNVPKGSRIGPEAYLKVREFRVETGLEVEGTNLGLRRT